MASGPAVIEAGRGCGNAALIHPERRASAFLHVKDQPSDAKLRASAVPPGITEQAFPPAWPLPASSRCKPNPFYKIIRFE